MFGWLRGKSKIEEVSKSEEDRKKEHDLIELAGRWINPHLHIAVIHLQLANRRSLIATRIISCVKSFLLITTNKAPRTLQKS